MGRYTTVQAYSDNNPKLVHVSYDQAKAKDDPEGGKAGGKLVTEKTDQVMGSCAGAGSGEFHTYRAHRRREMHRVAEMDEEARRDEESAKLQTAIEKGQKECDERTRKNADKRKRRKQAAKAAKSGGTDAKKAKTNADGNKSSSSPSSGSSDSNGGSDGDAVEEFVYIPVADRAASGGDGGAPAAFKNDGSFLELMKKELEAKGGSSVDAGKVAPAVGGGGKAVAAN